MFFDIKAVTIKRSRTEADCLYWHIRILLFITRAPPRINSESYSLWFWQQFTLDSFQMFWNHTERLRFVLSLRILNSCIEFSVFQFLILKKCPQFLTPLTTMLLNTYPKQLYFFTGKAPLNLWCSPKSVVLPYFCGAPLNLRKDYSTNGSPKCALLPQICFWKKLIENGRFRTLNMKKMGRKKNCD